MIQRKKRYHNHFLNHQMLNQSHSNVHKVLEKMIVHSNQSLPSFPFRNQSRKTRITTNYFVCCCSHLALFFSFIHTQTMIDEKKEERRRKETRSYRSSHQSVRNPSEPTRLLLVFIRIDRSMTQLTSHAPVCFARKWRKTHFFVLIFCGIDSNISTLMMMICREYWLTER